MMRVLITGMSGTGKSSVIAELAGQGYEAHDLDQPAWSHWVDCDPSDDLTPAAGQDWVWREDRVRDLICRPRSAHRFVAGCASNMTPLLEHFDRVVLLTAPIDTLVTRLANRPDGDYGSSEDDRRKVGALVASVEPLLRAIADHVVDTRGTVAATAAEVLRALSASAAGTSPVRSHRAGNGPRRTGDGVTMS